MTSATSSPKGENNPALAALKAYRRLIYQPAPAWRNAFLRKRQTWQSGLPRAELLRHLVRLLVRDARVITSNIYRQPAGVSPPTLCSKPVIVAGIAGGLGDLIIAARFLESLCQRCGLVFWVAYHDTALATLILSRCERFLGVDDVMGEWRERPCVARLQIGLVIDQIDIAAEAPESLRCYLSRAQETCEKFRDYLRTSPFLDGLLGNQLTSHGVRRHEAAFWQSGLTYGKSAFLRPDDDTIRQLLAKYGLTGGRYITINDGWDATFGLLNGRRPTKALPVATLSELVRNLKSLRSDLTLVQIGSSRCGNPIEGVDLNLRGRTDLMAVSVLLAGAAAHIDTEGGLVHLANAVGARSAVFFGPTDATFFAYPDNQTLLPPNSCCDCWWSTNTWMAICPLRRPVTCLQSFSARDSAVAIIDFIAARWRTTKEALI